MNLIAFVVIGGVSALLYFTGLWWTVRRLAASRHPHTTYLGSLVLRVTLLVCVIWLPIHLGQLPALAAFFAGFLVARVLLVRYLAGSLIRTGEQ